LFIGKCTWGNHFDGQIDEVRIWNTVRTQSEINRLLYSRTDWNERPDLFEPGLISYYPFDRTTDKIAKDLMGYHNGALKGTATPVFGNIIPPPMAKEFDGSTNYIRIPHSEHEMLGGHILIITFYLVKPIKERFRQLQELRRARAGFSP